MAKSEDKIEAFHDGLSKRMNKCKALLSVDDDLMRAICTGTQDAFETFAEKNNFSDVGFGLVKIEYIARTSLYRADPKKAFKATRPKMRSIGRRTLKHTGRDVAKLGRSIGQDLLEEWYSFVRIIRTRKFWNAEPWLRNEIFLQMEDFLKLLSDIESESSRLDVKVR